MNNSGLLRYLEVLAVFSMKGLLFLKFMSTSSLRTSHLSANLSFFKTFAVNFLTAFNLLSSMDSTDFSSKPPNSTVEGDLRPCLLRAHYDKIVTPVTNIFNAIFRDVQWPAAWKVETTVVIPKTHNPSSLAECRNISCTNFLSKVLEMVLLDDLRLEIAPDPVQYGGVKKCSVNHLLVDLYESVLSPLEEGNPSIVLGIDYEKAFNRLDHQECIRQLRRLGATDITLALVRSFLTDRSMRVRVAGELSAARKLQGGSPQGSILGCALYCATTQRIGPELCPDGLGAVAVPPPPVLRNHEARGPPSPQNNDNNNSNGSFGIMEHMAPDLSSSGASASSDDSFATALGSPLPLGELAELAPSLEFFKYVDDTTVVETVNRELGVRHISTASPQEVIPASLLEPLMTELIQEVESIGMRVNCAKTQMIVIANDTGYNMSAALTAGGVQIQSVDSKKLLGFMVSGSGMAAQVAFIKTKFRRNFWSLIHLRRSGIKGDHLFKLYCVLLRPVIQNLFDKGTFI